MRTTTEIEQEIGRAREARAKHADARSTHDKQQRILDKRIAELQTELIAAYQVAPPTKTK